MLPLAKRTIRLLAIAIVSPLLLTHWLGSWVSGADRSLESHSQFLSLIPGTTGSYLRVAFYRFALAHCDPSVTIGFGVLFSKTAARLEQNVYIGPRCMLGWVRLGPDVLLGPAVQIPSGPHTHGVARLDVPIREQPGSPRCIDVGADSWVGAGAMILADVGAQCVVGGGSIVTKPTRPRTISAGIPAREIGKRGEATTLPERPQGTESPVTQADEVRAERIG
ncbi:acyltransferase [Roseiconus lacunae]|uniref:acyltransferase n=1 Tax=Roseiconus lacunae TaxID=2605694 RepID=UPI001E55FF7D|nr:hypothetical protein [Roseiconus lacunae]MCD0458876.1 hypothetical protein [Roseiconus lacunae]